MHSDFLETIYRAHQQPKQIPGTEEVAAFIDDLLGLLFPELSGLRLDSRLAVETQFNVLRLRFEKLLFHTEACNNARVKSLCKEFMDALPRVYALSIGDADAMLEGDPAAVDREEVVRTYPGFYAIAVYRIAHLMHTLHIPYLPRIFTEYAHSRTGIDIHPGATIGERFFVDHGSGVVIGETATIGNDVKLYQGVTLGALSVSKDMASQKRHPTIGDHVVIYSGTTILGGRTTIGHHSIIGGNVWLTRSVPPYSKIYYSAEGSQYVKAD